MTSLLIAVGFILCTAILLWLDRARERDLVRERGAFAELFDFISEVDWNIHSPSLRRNLGAEVVAESEDARGSLSRNLTLDGYGALINYRFNEGGRRLIRVKIEIGDFSQTDFDFLFRGIYRRYGSPQAMTDESEHDGALAWSLPGGKTLHLEEGNGHRASVSVSHDQAG